MEFTQQNLPTVCLMKPRIFLKQGQSNPTAHNGFWKKNWSINVPNKIKYFLWRAWREALPTKKNLCHRKVTHNSTFEFCNGEEEDTIHVLWECQVTKEIWWEIEPCRSNLSTRFTCLADLLTGIFHCNEPNLTELLAFVAWSTWTKRNAARLRNCSVPYSKIFADAKDRLYEYQAAQKANQPELAILDPSRWSPPPVHLLRKFQRRSIP